MSKHILESNYFIEIDEQKSWHWNQLPEDFIIKELAYEKNIFVHEDFYISKGIKKEIVIVHYPKRYKTYILDKLDYNGFVFKYFPDKIVLKKKPSFFMFQIPLPLPFHSFAHSNIYSNHPNHQFTISKNIIREYRNDYDFILRLDCRNFEEKNNFDSIFFNSFEEIIEFSEQYKNYMSNLLTINKSLIKTNKIIHPFYKISPEEIDEITSVFFDILDQQEKQSETSWADYHDKIFNSELDELNWIALEKDSSNYWNID